VVHLAIPTVYFVAGNGWTTAAHELPHQMKHARHPAHKKLLKFARFGTLEIFVISSVTLYMAYMLQINYLAADVFPSHVAKKYRCARDVRPACSAQDCIWHKLSQVAPNIVLTILCGSYGPDSLGPKFSRVY